MDAPIQHKPAPPFWKSLQTRDYFMIGVALTVFTYLFAILDYSTLNGGMSVCSWLVHMWNTHDDSGHGFMVPLIVVGLVYWQKDQLNRLIPATEPKYIIVLVLGTLVYLVGRGGSPFPGAISLIIFVFGFVGFLFGHKFVKVLLFPLCFLLFMVPWAAMELTQFLFKLRLLMATVSVPILNALGVPCLREGTIILSLPDAFLGLGAGQKFSLNVDGPCSGIRSLFALNMMTALYGYLTQPTLTKKWIIFLTAVPLALAGNVLRIILLTIGSDWVSVSFAVGTLENPSWFHNMAGYAVWILALCILYGIDRLLNRKPEKPIDTNVEPQATIGEKTSVEKS